MSTQHPDNITRPYFVKGEVMTGDEEVTEAYLAFSHFGCDEQMWDTEAKEADHLVVRKLLERFPHLFKRRKLGEEFRLTYRIPNPDVEKDDAIILPEILNSIPRAFATAKKFYNGETKPPIFEVILPMTTSAQQLQRIMHLYRHIHDLQFKKLSKDDITIGELIGELSLDRINVIPLFEDRESMLGADGIVEEFIKAEKPDYQRVFLARSDPAMNYGMVSAVLLNKIALQRLATLAQRTGTPIYPIVGAGGPPFRGSLLPHSVERVIREYPSAATFTVQSAFKYDNHREDVAEATKKLREREIGAPTPIDEAHALDIIERYAKEYYSQIAGLAKLINNAATYVPSRRMRKMHTGIWGLSRQVGDLQFPRVISFSAALYSLGLPPELFGLTALTNDDISFLKDTYPGFVDDVRDAARFFKPSRGLMPAGLEEKVRAVAGDVPDDETARSHRELTSYFASSIRRGKEGEQGLQQAVMDAADLRGFLG